MIVVFGSLNADLVFRMARAPTAGQTLLADSLTTQPGGKGANQAVAAAQDGARVALVGAIGTDALAAITLPGLEAAGVDLSALRRVELPTGCASICTDHDGRNQIAVAPGANLAAHAEQVPDALLGPGTTLVLQMETPREAVEALIRRARAAAGRVILNLAPALPLDRAALAQLDLLVVNEDEAAMLAALLGTAVTAAALHAALGVGVILTLGAAGAEAATAEGVLAVPAPPVTAVDTTAAGDCFVGVLASGLDRGLALAPAMRRAVAAASLACQREGSQRSLPWRAQTDAACREAEGDF